MLKERDCRVKQNHKTMWEIATFDAVQQSFYTNIESEMLQMNNQNHVLQWGRSVIHFLSLFLRLLKVEDFTKNFEAAFFSFYKGNAFLCSSYVQCLVGSTVSLNVRLLLSLLSALNTGLHHMSGHRETLS